MNIRPVYKIDNWLPVADIDGKEHFQMAAVAKVVKERLNEDLGNTMMWMFRDLHKNDCVKVARHVIPRWGWYCSVLHLEELQNFLDGPHNVEAARRNASEFAAKKEKYLADYRARMAAKIEAKTKQKAVDLSGQKLLRVSFPKEVWRDKITDEQYSGVNLAVRSIETPLAGLLGPRRMVRVRDLIVAAGGSTDNPVQYQWFGNPDRYDIRFARKEGSKASPSKFYEFDSLPQLFKDLRDQTRFRLGGKERIELLETALLGTAA